MTQPNPLVGKTVTVRLWPPLVNGVELAVVEVMAVADGYAMVRRKACIPFVCMIRDIETPDKPTTSINP